MADTVVLVNELDEVVGSMDKIEAHRGDGKLHRAISVYLFRKNPQTQQVELLVQQRSNKKIVGALCWANTVCGNVWPGESYEACALRRLDVELGITSDGSGKPIELQPVEKFQYQVKCNEEFSENEMDQVFVGWFSDSPSQNPDEVVGVEWVSWDALVDVQARKNMQKNWAPWFDIMMENKKIVHSLESYIGNK
jgi:isopentenyl-diphosphate delta-isomerase